jgi:hypothetical protein
METRANYIVTGAFTLAVIVGVFGFIFWFQNSSGGGERSGYRVVFAGSVSGLRTGSAVLFNGFRVGEVSRLGLDAHDPGKVVARPLASAWIVRVFTAAKLSLPRADSIDCGRTDIETRPS